MTAISDCAGVITTHDTWISAAEYMRAHLGTLTGPDVPTLLRSLQDAPFPRDWSAASESGVFVVRLLKPGEVVPEPDTDWSALFGETPAEPDHKARSHSRLGASVAERFWNCPASIRRSEGVPNRETPAAKRGTAAHEVAHMCLVSGQDAIEYVGRTVHGIEVDPAMADAVQVYLDDCRETPGTEAPAYEVQFDLESMDPPEPMYGTADFVRYDAETQTLHVKDYKNGYLQVSATGNKQLRYYALGALIALGMTRPVSQIEITICQPNSIGADLKRESFDAIHLVEWSADLMQRARATQDPDAPAAAGSWCTFCPVAGVCRDRMEKHLADAGTEFDNLPALPETRLLTPADLGRIHAAAPLIRDYLKAVAQAIAADPTGTGWKAVATEGRDAWRDPSTVGETLELIHEIEPWAPRTAISPAKARDALAERLRPDHKTKKAATAAARAALADLIFKPKSGAVLVPDADPRPAISNGAEFDMIGTDDNE